MDPMTGIGDGDNFRYRENGSDELVVEKPTYLTTFCQTNGKQV
jgi:hypothetical protein